MTKMDMIWLATAKLLYPQTSPRNLFSREEIEQKIRQLFNESITPIMVERHLVSWQDRQADKNNPSRGGSRNRYLFRTDDGLAPSVSGRFRLYKHGDSRYDGKDKTGKTHPILSDILEGYSDLVEWYWSKYFTE